MVDLPAPLVGGLLLSFATSTLLLDQGRILGCSGTAHACVNRLVDAAATSSSDGSSSRDPHKDKVSKRADDWKVSVVAGLVAGGAVLSYFRSPIEALLRQPIFDGVPNVSLARAIVAGAAVGMGTKLGRGCTSGHMLIGMARFSKRSIAATMTFFPVAFLTARLFPYAVPALSASVATIDPSRVSPTLFSLALLPIVSSLVAHRLFPSRLASLIQSFSVSVLFSLGLALTGMLRPSKVLSFFYVPLPVPFETSAYPLPPFDPSLALVAVGGLAPNILAWHLLSKRRNAPRKSDKWEVPTGGEVDRRLIGGSALFGFGWGLMGVCPGPLLAVLGSGTGGSVVSAFAAAFSLGGLAVDKLF
ncbi:hypothetical protein JCM10212_002922 [Sporobolomyces blumeae]